MSYDIWEERRQSMGWYWARAYNTRFSAYIIYENLAADLSIAAANVNYSGNPETALKESFLRETAIAIELISKAALATKIHNGTSKSKRRKMPKTHDLFLLFDDLGIELTDDRQVFHLNRLTEILYWAGKYGAPNKGAPTNSRGKKYDEMIERACRTGAKIGDQYIPGIAGQRPDLPHGEGASCNAIATAPGSIFARP